MLNRSPAPARTRDRPRWGAVPLVRAASVLALVAAILMAPDPARGAASMPPGFQESEVLSDFYQPTALRFASNGQVFVAEKAGFVWAFDDIDDTTPSLVVDLREAVHNYWDRGLLGAAVHPDYPAVPYLYVLYAHDAYANLSGPRWGTGGGSPSTDDPCPSPPGANDDGCVVFGRLSRVLVDQVTWAGTEEVLLEGNWCQQYPSHSIGDLVFGQDGYLYVSAGDGASFTFADIGQDGSPVNPCDDPPDGIGGPNTGPSAEGGSLRSMDIHTPGDLTSYDGSLLRIDVSSVPVTAPADNPLVGNGVADDDFIVATGMRNPFRIGHRPGTDEIWFTDVGSELWEELNRMTNPLGDVDNFGWPCYEGDSSGSAVQAGHQNQDICQDLYTGGPPAGIAIVPPFFAYHHEDKVVPGELCGSGSSSATGVAFYTGTNYPSAYDDAVFFADASRNCIWTIFADVGGEPDKTNIAALASNTAGRPVDIQMAPDGNLYYVDFDGGGIFRIEFFQANLPPIAVLTATPTAGQSPLLVSFDASGSSDPEDGPNLSYAWDLDNDGFFDDSTLVDPTHSFSQAGAHLVRVRVEDTGSATDIASIVITVGNTPPMVTIDAPLPTLQWSVNEIVPFSGTATDPENGPLPPEAFNWEIILHHCITPEDCHTHPVTSQPLVDSGTFDAPDHEVPSFVELKATVTDLLPVDWFDPAWTKRRMLSLDNSAQGETLTDFPILVTLDSSRIDYGLTQPGGADLRFADVGGQELAYEIEHWDELGTSSVWVKVPSLTGGSSGEFIWMYYDNPSAADAQDPGGVWSNGYVAVWHLHDDFLDSTLFANDGTNQGSSDVAGMIADAQTFDGINDSILVTSHSSLEITGQLTTEAWVAIDDPSLNRGMRVVSKKTAWDGSVGYNLEYGASNDEVTAIGSGSDVARGAAALDTSYHHLAGVVNGATAALFLDGADVTTDASVSPLVASGLDLRIGARSTGADFWLGELDEVRISDVSRSADWIAAQHLSMTDGMLTYGDLEAAATLSASASVEVHPLTVDLTLDTDPQGLEVVLAFEAHTSPYVATVIVNSNASISVPSPQQIGNALYEFVAWSDAGAQGHNFSAPAVPMTITASFQKVAECSDGIDNDLDGNADWPNDPGCRGTAWHTESPACSDGADNDADGFTDLADPDCTFAWQIQETPPRLCAIGFELVLLMPLLAWLRGRRRRS